MIRIRSVLLAAAVCWVFGLVYALVLVHIGAGYAVFLFTCFAITLWLFRDVLETPRRK